MTVSAEEEKKREKKIADLKKRIDEAQKKRDEVKEEVKKFDSHEDKKVQYEEKVPEELLAARSKNEAIRREIKKITSKIES